ncbi:hypothetical protein JTB14_036295 [Gonioctena quinquepunctata]|nr:hypothetical protein JTB14_036295 [Gonioctena quinquepunctata]
MLMFQSERFTILLQSCRWYRWNRENKHFLLVFLAATKEPLIFSFGGLLEQNHMLMLKVFRSLYTIVTFYSSYRN